MSSYMWYYINKFVLVESKIVDGKMPPHLDNDDHINAIATVGDCNITGGGT